MRVLITGGAGFIGSHLCDILVNQGRNVSILDNLSTGTEKNITQLKNKIKIIKGDIRDKALAETLIKNTDLILHMAAAVGVENILKNPVDSISTNYHGSEVILNAANKFDKRIIIASTSEIYGKNNSQPLSENDDRVIGVPQKLRWTYSDAKALEEAIAHSLYLSNNLRVTTIRLFNTVGPRQTGKYGMVIPRFVKSALENKPLNIFGNGSQSRVFCHVLDTARAIIDLSVNSNTYGEVFNIGGEGEVTVFDLAKLIIEITNSSSKIVFSAYEDVFPVGYEDMQRRVPDISKIRNFIGWKPLFDLRKIIEDVAQSLS